MAISRLIRETYADEVSTSVEAENALQSILLSIAELAPVDTVAQRLAEAALGLTGADYAALGAYDAESQLRDFAAAGMTPEERARLPHPPRGIGLLGEFARGAGTIATPDVRTDSHAAGFPEGHPAMQAFLGVPVRSGGETIGAFYVAKRPGGAPFEQADRIVLEELAPYAAIALANALRLERERARTAVAEMLVTTAKTQQQASDEQETIEALIAALADAAPEAIGIAVRWTSPDGDDYLYAARDGSDGLTAALLELADDDFAEGSQELTGLLPGLRVTLHAKRLPDAGCLALAATSRASLGEIGREAMCSLVELGAIGVAATGRREAEAALERYEERDAIARDLHDDLIQSIYAVGLSLRAALSAQPDEIRRALSKGVDDLDAARLQDAIVTVGRGGSLLDPKMATAVLDRIRRGQLNHPADDALSMLTPQEDRILTFIGEGLTNREIANELRLSEKTIKNCVSQIYAKLNIERRSQAASIATEHRLRKDQ